MQSADQQHQPEEPSTVPGGEGSGQEEAQPLYEFPAGLETSQEVSYPGIEGQTVVAPGETPRGSAEPDQQALALAVQQGLIYPPPPSYYQNMSYPAEQPALAPPAPRIIPAAGQMQPLVAPPTRPAYPSPVAPVKSQTAKRSRRWIWIIVSVLAVSLLAGCGLCGWGFYTIFNTAFQSTSGSLQTVNDFYANLQSQNYSAAYADLDIPNLTLTQFAQQAQLADQQKGTLESYMPQSPSVSLNSNNGPDLTHFTYAISITRTKSSYSALITVTQEGKNWKITDFDRL